MKGGGFILRKTITILTTLLLCMVIVVLFIEQKHLNDRQEIIEVESAEDPIAGVIKTQYDILKVVQETSVEICESETTVVAEPQWVEMDVPSNNSFKSYMDYRKVTDRTSSQYSFLQTCENSACGIMLAEGRYVVAVGSYYTTEIGTRIDLVMSNGEIVECITGDCKDNDDTDILNRQHNSDGSVVEFVVNTDILSDYVKFTSGDCSYADSRLMGEIETIRVYTIN